MAGKGIRYTAQVKNAKEAEAAAVAIARDAAAKALRVSKGAVEVKKK